MTFGLSCAIIAIMYAIHVTGFNKFNKNYDRLYSVEAYVTYFNGDRFPKEYLSASLKEIIEKESPEIESSVRIANRQFSFKNGEKSFDEEGIYADKNFFDVFTFPVTGNKTNLLEDINSIAISERTAMKFFGSADCTGKSIPVSHDNKEEVFTISGVFKDVPVQSGIQFDFVIPFERFISDNKWALETGATSNSTWVLLKENAARSQVEKKISKLLLDRESTMNQELFLFPMKDKLLYSYVDGKRVWKEMQYVFIVCCIGFVILLIACFNFINLTIAVNLRRNTEIAVKRIAGCGRIPVIAQLLGESYLLILVSMGFAIIISRLLLTGINVAMHNEIQMKILEIRTLLILISLIVITGFASGFLPSFYLASLKPAESLKWKKNTANSFRRFRQSLIVIQFTIPVTLIIVMLIIKAQDSYMRNFDVGLEKDNTIILNTTEKIIKNEEGFRSDLLAIPGVEAVTFTNCIPSRGASVTNAVKWEGMDASKETHFWRINADYDYDKIVRLVLNEGRFFNRSFSTDTSAFLINDVAVKVMELKNPVGSVISVDGRQGTIIGVFRDFHAIDLAGPVVPSIMRNESSGTPYVLIKFSSAAFGKIRDAVNGVFRIYDPESQMHAGLFSDLEVYSSPKLPYTISGIAFIIAILLACLGLYGLASFTAESRTKEIGIRKANGATTLSLVALLLSDFAGWLVISVIIALPLAYIAGKFFLGRYYFHASFPVWSFFAGPAITIMIAILTVISQTIKTANRNPVRALRYE